MRESRFIHAVMDAARQGDEQGFQDVLSVLKNFSIANGMPRDTVDIALHMSMAVFFDKLDMTPFDSKLWLRRWPTWPPISYLNLLHAKDGVVLMTGNSTERNGNGKPIPVGTYVIFDNKLYTISIRKTLTAGHFNYDYELMPAIANNKDPRKASKESINKRSVQVTTDDKTTIRLASTQDVMNHLSISLTDAIWRVGKPQRLEVQDIDETFDAALTTIEHTPATKIKNAFF